MDRDKIWVLVVEPGKSPYPKMIKNTLDSLQAEVGGYIEVVYPFKDRVALICDEEGKLKGEPDNRILVGKDGVPYDTIAGKFILAGIGGQDFYSLSDSLMIKYYLGLSYDRDMVIKRFTPEEKKVVEMIFFGFTPAKIVSRMGLKDKSELAVLLRQIRRKL